jgi:tyrosinase
MPALIVRNFDLRSSHEMYTNCNSLVYNSPSDPYFWNHHAQIDRVWWTWQNQNLKDRRYTIAGTLTFQNQPPTRNATLDDVMTFGDYIGFPNITIKDASSTLAGPFCYIYE